MKIQDIITTFKGKTFSSHEEVVEWVESSLTSLLDSIEKDAIKNEINDDAKYSTEYKNGFNDCLEKVINIINSHR